MRRLENRTTDILTTAHKLVGFAWVVSTALVLGLGVLGRASGAVDWERVAAYDRIGSMASIATFGFGAAYVLFTSWSIKNPWVLAKWALYILAVGVSGYAITATHDQDATTLIWLAAVELTALLALMGMGVYLERTRHSGK
jgi:hypothetical protein